MEEDARQTRVARRTAGLHRSIRAFTLIELMLAVGVVGALASVAVVNYSGYVEKARVARAIAEIKSISRVIDGLRLNGEGPLPDTLAEVDLGNMVDPWGGPYQYLKIDGGLPGGMGGAPSLPPVAAAPGGPGGGPPVIAAARKDQFLVPINSDYDLYSMGPDGKTKPSLNTQEGRDDIIRARDGAFVGVAEDF